MRTRKGRKRAIGIKMPLLVVAKRNARWSLDIVHNQIAGAGGSGSSTWLMTSPTSASPPSPDTSISDHRVAGGLTALLERRGRPVLVIGINGTEFTSHANFTWVKGQRIE